ncbi:recombination protein RecR [candidate division KSB3 bacterium]|uniref:Recombination protein RecR n=1 Tax=candidate division KSB3 bacterium TaxID=2044937 RepID=A0A2G6E428_9BACT|nr:MAG: recombination protein RecR [candidate division KSB3 bacterium]PIE29129.1 MAG: recombination protein RecR [candidate division KSB3 bacterium]
MLQQYTESVARLINELTKLPGIGEKSAQRLTFFLLKAADSDVKALATALLDVKEHVGYCSVCGNITEQDPCMICNDDRRQRRLICVVEEPHDLYAIERTREYFGLYHVLMGALSPLEGIGPEDIHIQELLHRLQQDPCEEIIIATNPNVEGEATAMYLAKLLKPIGVKISRIAHGIPVGSDLEYADEITMTRALEGRREL